MVRTFLRFIVIFFLILNVWASDGEKSKILKEKNIVRVYVIPIEGQISSAQLFILRRGLKEAIAQNIDEVLFSIHTPGGDLKTTLAIMEALEKFNGETISFINTEAISAGAYIAAATDEIYFHPKGIMGAAAAIQATGKEIPETLSQKLNSYLRARVRSYTATHRYRSEVIRAMMDSEYVFKIGEKIIKEKGELLTLTATEALAEYGKPPEKLLAKGVAESVDDLLKQKFGEGNYAIKNFKLTGAEYVARWLNAIAPILLGLGLLLLFIEFKTPGFGVFGIAGISLLLLVFLSSYIAGLAGYEGIAVFFLGLILIAVELFIFPGLIVPGALGVVFLLGALIWALADVWPTEDFKFDFEVFVGPLTDVFIGVMIALVSLFLVGKYVFKKSIFQALVLNAASGNETLAKDQNLVGSVGVAVGDLHPEGEIEIKGKRYPVCTRGSVFLNAGTQVQVVKQSEFNWIVKAYKHK